MFKENHPLNILIVQFRTIVSQKMAEVWDLVETLLSAENLNKDFDTVIAEMD